MWKLIHKYSSFKYFYTGIDKIKPFLIISILMLLSYGVIGGLFLSPTDYKQQDAFRMIYVHVPTAFLSLGVYSLVAICSFIYLVWKIKIADVIAKVSVPIGAGFTLLALITGAIWGKPMWGTWWVWDARLTSELILLFIYLGLIGIRSSISKSILAAQSSAIFALVGILDLPIIHYSVKWWHTLHQGPSLASFSKPTIAASMLYPLLAMISAMVLFYVYLLIDYSKIEILWRDRKTDWVKQLLFKEDLKSE